jgi:predicted ester cyclase
LGDSENGQEHNEVVARRWFTQGWAGDTSLADVIFDDAFVSNGQVVGPSGPKRNVRRRIVGFPDLQIDLDDLIAVGEQVVIRLTWSGTHSGSYGGVEATGRRVVVRVIVMWRFRAGKVAEDWTVQDQFSLLRQVDAISPHLSL